MPWMPWATGLGLHGSHWPAWAALVTHQQGFGEGGQAGAAKTLMTTSAGDMSGMLGSQKTADTRGASAAPLAYRSGNSTLRRGSSSSRRAPAAAGPPEALRLSQGTERLQTMARRSADSTLR